MERKSVVLTEGERSSDVTRMAKERTVFLVWLRNLKEDLGGNGMIILKWSLK